MRLDRIVCLANSYKHDNRCVAGISLVTRKWVRLIGGKVPGCLTRSEARCTDGTELSLLDVFEVELEADCGSNYHPEDVVIAGTPWQRIRRFDEAADLDLLKEAVNPEPIVLQGYCDRIDKQNFEGTPARVSLSLVEPEDLWWWIRKESGKRRFRANFRLGREGRIRYDLPVTDPAWLDQLHLLPEGIHPHSLLCAGKCSQTYFTASLSEPFEGFHYKLVAGVIVLPAR
jgi:Dual OB-containing domain